MIFLLNFCILYTHYAYIHTKQPTDLPGSTISVTFKVRVGRGTWHSMAIEIPTEFSLYLLCISVSMIILSRYLVHLIHKREKRREEIFPISHTPRENSFSILNTTFSLWLLFLLPTLNAQFSVLNSIIRVRIRGKSPSPIRFQAGHRVGVKGKTLLVLVSGITLVLFLSVYCLSVWLQNIHIYMHI